MFGFFSNQGHFVSRKYLLINLLIFLPLAGRSQSFQTISGIPHLPVFATKAAVSAKTTPLNGMLIYSQEDGKPMIYNGSSWADLCSASLSATTENYFVVKAGIPCIPAKTTVGGTPTHGSLYFSTTDNAVMVYGSNGWNKVKYMNLSSYTENDGFACESSLKVVRFPVKATAPTGVSEGAVYIDGSTLKITFYNGSSWQSVACAWICGDNLIVNHSTSDNVSPETTTITYETVSSNISGNTKCWIIQNLGASEKASSLTDTRSVSRGWFWQFNRKQGYICDGAAPSGWDATLYYENSNWTSANDPCTLLLGTGWRIPTGTTTSGGEWSTIMTSFGGVDANAYSSALKLHEAGYIDASSSTLLNSGSQGRWWSSVAYDNGVYERANLGALRTSNTTVTLMNKPNGLSIRCIKD